MTRFRMLSLFVAAILAVALPCAQAATIPQVEIQALDRAIRRELSEDKLGSQTLGDLQRLKHRLETLGSPAGQALAELEPLGGAGNILARLEQAAASGDRSALRNLAFHHLAENNPEAALQAWRKMGGTNPNDLSYQILSSYLELALGEHNAARLHLETAGRLIDTRTGLGLSTPIFCDNIAGYRLYVPREKKEILPGDNTLLYVEIEGADFHPLPDGNSECRLMFGMKLRNEHGTTLWAEANYGEYAPLFAGSVRDLHTALSWRVPNDLQPGVYNLTVEVEEQPSLRRGETVLEVTIANRPTNPAPKLDAGMRQEVNKALQEATRQFPGSTPLFQPQSPQESERSERMFDLLRDSIRLQGGQER